MKKAAAVAVNLSMSNATVSMMKNPFDLLEIKHGYLIDLEELTQKYIDKQRKFHPDMHITKSPTEKLHASSMAIDLNHAFETLKDPFQRGIALLLIRGGEFDFHKSEHNFEILSQTMADQERLNQISTRQDIEKFSTECDLRFDMLQNNLHSAFNKNDINLAGQYLNSLKYLMKSKSDLDRKRRLLNKK